jgi:hypothetical protein
VQKLLQEPAACIEVGVYECSEFFGVDDGSVAHDGLQVRFESGADGRVTVLAWRLRGRGSRENTAIVTIKMTMIINMNIIHIIMAGDVHTCAAR